MAAGYKYYFFFFHFSNKGSQLKLLKRTTIISLRLLVVLKIRAQLFKTKYANIFAEKNVSSFCIRKSYSHFFSKNTCELDIVLTRAVNVLTTNELIKLISSFS